jgi:hypothetical protein
MALKGADSQLDLSPPTPAEIGQLLSQPASAPGLQFDVATSEQHARCNIDSSKEADPLKQD